MGLSIKNTRLKTSISLENGRDSLRLNDKKFSGVLLTIAKLLIQIVTGGNAVTQNLLES